MKTKLLVLCTAVFTLGLVSSCDAPRRHSRSYYPSHHHHHHGSSGSVGGYRGGGAGGGFGGSFGGFTR